MKRNLSLLLLNVLVATLCAQAPSGYYNAASGKAGAALKTALYGIIGSHTDVGYAGLFNVYKQSDVRADGTIWDMYSCVTSFDPETDHSGNYHTEGDVFNREHSVPKSWFSNASPMRSDAFHVIPTDGYVNNRRSNYPYGETLSPTYASTNNFSLVGPCDPALGYSGTIFEPNDEYKGDLARIYFYMATAYEDKIGSWSGTFGAGKYPGLTDWQLKMMLRWAADDPVSEKETARNEAVYKFQHNRNPFVDFPGLEQYVWGSKTDVAFDPTNYGTTSGDDEDTVSPPVFTPAQGTVAAGTVVTITTATDGADIYYAISGGEEVSAPAPVSLTLNASAILTARAELNGIFSPTVTAQYTVIAAQEGNTWQRVTGTEALQAGRNYLIVCEAKGTALAEATESDVRSYAAVTLDDSLITTETGAAGYPYALTLGGQRGAWTLYDATGGTYLALESDKNKLQSSTSADDDATKWDITITGGTTHIYNKAYTTREIQYNAAAPRFACYTGSEQSVSLFVQTQEGTTGLSTAPAAAPRRHVDVRDAAGRIVRGRVEQSKALLGLPAGLYIVGKTKVLVP